MKEYALYKGEECLHIGTAMEIAQAKNIKVTSVRFMRTPAYQRRLNRRKNSKNAMILIEIEEDENEKN